MSRITRVVVRSAALLAVAAAALAAFHIVVAPWYERWGASAAEARQALPGDEILPNATHQEIYSFDLLEKVVRREMPTVDVVRLDKQSWRPGDKLWMYPPEKLGGIGFATLRTYVPGRVRSLRLRADAFRDGAPDAIGLRRRDWWRPLGAFAGAAIVLQVLMLVQPDLPVGVALVAALLASLWWPEGGSHAAARAGGPLTRPSRPSRPVTYDTRRDDKR